MARIFCIANQKGGVGKTTTAVNLASGLAKLDKRVLLIDLDPQGNATSGSGLQKSELGKTIYHVLIGLAKASEVLKKVQTGGFTMMPSNRDLAAAEVEMVDLDRRESRLKEAIDEIEDDYDYILIDCPPALSLLTVNALCCAEGVIIPMQCEYFALEGLSDLVNTIRLVAGNMNKQLKIIGILRVMFDKRATLAQHVSDQLESHFKDQVFKTVIPRNVRLAEAPSFGIPGVDYDPSSRGAKAYIEFAGELIEWLKN